MSISGAGPGLGCWVVGALLSQTSNPQGDLFPARPLKDGPGAEEGQALFVTLKPQVSRLQSPVAEAEASGKLRPCHLQQRPMGASPGPRLMGIRGPVHTVVYSWVGSSSSHRRLSCSHMIKVLAMQLDLNVVKPLALLWAPRWLAGGWQVKAPLGPLSGRWHLASRGGRQHHSPLALGLRPPPAVARTSPPDPRPWWSPLSARPAGPGPIFFVQGLRGKPRCPFALDGGSGWSTSS